MTKEKAIQKDFQMNDLLFEATENDGQFIVISRSSDGTTKASSVILETFDEEVVDHFNKIQGVKITATSTMADIKKQLGDISRKSHKPAYT